MTAGPKAAVDGASLPFRPRGRPVLGILQPTLIIPTALSLTRRCATLGETKPVSATVADCDLDGNQFVWASLRPPHQELETHPKTHTYGKLSRPRSATRAMAL